MFTTLPNRNIVPSTGMTAYPSIGMTAWMFVESMGHGNFPALETCRPETPGRRVVDPGGKRSVVALSRQLGFGSQPTMYRPGPGDAAQTAAMHASSSAMCGLSTTTCNDEYLYRCMRGDWADLQPGVCMHVCVHVHMRARVKAFA